MSLQNPLLSKVNAKTFRATKAIRKLEPDFDAKAFPANTAQQIYVDAHKCLAEWVLIIWKLLAHTNFANFVPSSFFFRRKTEKLHDLVTEDLYPVSDY